ncbi:MAG: ABC transporter ATP-binding protein [Termitinemataceae bacterium]|nr:MAG: ABC transporter ATP-binding protein [Termitinemataceae bacterium]
MAEISNIKKSNKVSFHIPNERVDEVIRREKLIIKASNIIKDFKSGRETLHILRSLDFEVEEGVSVAITGGSGSGKSTLLNILGGLDHVDDGKVIVAGVGIEKLSENHLSEFRRSKIGFIFQFHYLLKDFSALENVMLPAYIAGKKKKRAIEKAKALLADVHLEDRMNHLPSELSGGERQRVAVARSMINNPAVILADEPTGNLDPENSDLVTELLYSGAKKWNKSLVLVTHDDGVASCATQRYLLSEGILSDITHAQ